MKSKCDQALRDILCYDLELPFSPDEITEATLLSDLELDSLEYVDFVAKVDVAFGIRISVPELREMKTYGDLLQTVWTRTNNQ